jgi:hypothetical protein
MLDLPILSDCLLPHDIDSYAPIQSMTDSIYLYSLTLYIVLDVCLNFSSKCNYLENNCRKVLARSLYSLIIQSLSNQDSIKLEECFHVTNYLF